MIGRRAFVKSIGAAAAAPALVRCAEPPEEPQGPRWLPEAEVRPDRSSVAVLAADAYDGRLTDVVRRGLELFSVPVRGRRVVLKPNLVEFDPGGVINTHPVLIAATIEALRELEAKEVIVAEGPGHRRDNEYLLSASGLADVLRDTGARYVDLNVDAVRPVRLRSHYTALDRLYLPATVLDAELFISMPKMKTHHWAGVTLSMKNLFGIVPSAVYGWPKNVLHWQGIDNSILDINAALTVPRFNIVDGIVGMEGNGPIQGTAKPTGVLVFGADPVAVDTTAASVMGLEPTRVNYLAEAGEFFGNAALERIEQRGESPGALRQSYDVVEAFESLKAGLAGAG
ncbi:MAG: DUF362 domain-containing protein [Gemmatimonadota bacterium]